MPIPIYNDFGILEKSLINKLIQKDLAIFLDYDGTLTPIVEHPDLAYLSTKMRSCLRRLSQLYPLAVISGRGLKDLKSKVKLSSIYYAGNHGLELSGPSIQFNIGESYRNEISKAGISLNESLNEIPGIYIEDKQFSLSIHYRNVEPSLIPIIGEKTHLEIKNNPKLKSRKGKKVIEIFPNIHWNKGSAVLWFLDYFNLKKPNPFPIYIGDDITDEDAFLAIKDKGIGILVNPYDKPTQATYSLNDSDEVYLFLNSILELKHP